MLSTDLLIGEKVQVVGSGYRLTDVIRALSNRAEYRDDLARRAEPFTRRYPTLLKATVLTGAAGLIVLGVLTWALPESKALLLGLWTLWILLVIGFLVTIEYIKHSFQNGEEVAALDEAELRQLALAGPAGHAAVLPVTTAEPLPSTSSAPIAATAAEAPVTDATSERDEPAAGIEADALLTEWFGSEPQPDAAPEPDPGAEPDAEPVQPEATAAVDAPEDEGPTRTAEPEEDEPEEDERAEHQRAEGEDRA